MPTTVAIRGLERFKARLNALPARITSGVKVKGPAASYAEIWELGAAYLSAPGPKTMWSTNALGEDTILTIQAPHGYIRVNRRKYLKFLEQEFHQVDWKHVTADRWTDILVRMMTQVAQRCADLIVDTAPIDTGQLRGAIQAVKPGDDLLQQGGDEDQNVFREQRYQVKRRA